MRVGVTLGEVSALSCCGRESIKSARLKSRIANQVSRRRGLYDEPQGGQYGHCHFYHHNPDKYSYPFQIHPSRRLDIQAFDIPLLVAVSAHPSSSDATRLCRELGSPSQLQQTLLLLLELVGVLWVFLSAPMRFLVSFLEGKVFPLMLACPCELLKSWLLLQVAKQDYLSYSARLNQAACPYLILPQTGVGCKP